MGDENIRAILKRAAGNTAYLHALLTDREAALRDMTLEPQERAILLAVPEDQLKRMVEQARKRTLLQSCLVKAGCVTAAAAALGVAIPSFHRTSMGITPEVREEAMARYFLETVAVYEREYKRKCGHYGSLEDLKKQGLECSPPDDPYTAKYSFEVTVQGDTFTATAHRKERPKTRSSFIVGQDGEVKELPPEDK
ncbi:MAG: hypothetical protein ABSE73_14885 [Planctomycetota bacterium]